METPVTLRIYDVEGRLVRALVEEALLPPGEHAVSWNGRRTSGQQVSSGMYFYVIQAGELKAREKLLLLK